MCSRATCARCGKVTWSGCGRHVDTVMAGVPEAQRCTCQPPPAPPPRSGGWFSRGRRRSGA
jgi:hypothetical protein